MPLFVAAIWGALIQIAGTLVGKVLLSLGITYLTFTGVDTSIGWAKSTFLSGLSGAPAATVALAGTMQVGTCVSMILSAVTTRLVLAGLTSGSITSMQVKK